MRQTFIGRILAVTSESVIMSTVDPSRSEAIALQAGAVIRAEAACLKGHVVRYTAEVSERTKCLSNPRFCIGSEYGLRAVFERREEPPVDIHADALNDFARIPPSERVA